MLFNFWYISIMYRSFTKNFLIWIVLGTCMLIWAGIYNYSYASTQPDAFIVEVQPSSFDINQAVDVTVKAVDINWNIIKDYQGDIFIEIDGLNDTADYVVPSDGLYTFIPQDQWVKTFSKWITIKKQWTFGIKVSDIINENIKGEKTAIVGDATHDTAATKSITIITPTDDGTEKNATINIIARAPDLPNSPYTIYINNSIVTQGTTDEIGDINTYASGTSLGTNQLQVKISNANNEIIGQSETTRFTYAPIKDWVFNSIQILPSSKIKQWGKATFNVYTSEAVSSAQITLSNGTSSPLDKKSDGLFAKEIAIDKEWTWSIDIQVINNGQKKTYTGVATILVEKAIEIGKIRLYSDSVDKTKLNVTRETIGTAPKYKIDYGINENQLQQFVVVSTNEIVLENLTLGKKYYLQITPLDEQSQVIGTPSKITEAIIGDDLSCVVKGIVVNDQQIGDKHYLVRSGVQNAENYIIYRAEFETSETDKMQKVGETTGTMFEYPYNKLAKKEEFAYYVVQAACKDGTNIKMDTVKKVKVWPVENVLLFIIVSAFLYCMYRLYIYSKD